MCRLPNLKLQAVQLHALLCQLMTVFCAISKKSDQTSKEHRRKTLLEKNKKELTCNLPNTPGEIVSFLITLAIRVLSHAFDRIAQLLTGMSCTSASRYSICTRPKQKKKPSSVIVMRISANYNCTERTGTDEKKWSFSLTIK